MPVKLRLILDCCLSSVDASPSQGVMVYWRCSWLYLMQHCLLSMCLLVLTGPGCGAIFVGKVDPSTDAHPLLVGRMVEIICMV